MEIYSPLPPEECARRISAAIDFERSALFSLTSFFGARQVVGRVNGASIRLRKRNSYQSSFQTFLSATLEPHDGGTVIRGETAMHPFTRIFVPIWFGSGILIGGIPSFFALLSLFTDRVAAPESVVPFLIIPGMLAFGYLLVGFGRYLARDEAQYLADFLRATLEAKDSALPHQAEQIPRRGT